MDVLFIVRSDAFQLGYKAALAQNARFLGAMTAYAHSLMATALSFTPQIVECLIGTKNDRPSSAELERLTRDFFVLDLCAFGIDNATRVVANVRYDSSGHRVELRGAKALAVCPLHLPQTGWLEWFLQSPRCPSCSVFPDMTDEYLSCRLCGYAGYQREDAASARRRFLESSGAAAVLPAVQAIMLAAEGQRAGARATYLLHRVSQLSERPAAAMKPLPWEGEQGRPTRS